MDYVTEKTRFSGSIQTIRNWLFCITIASAVYSCNILWNVRQESVVDKREVSGERFYIAKVVPGRTTTSQADYHYTLLYVPDDSLDADSQKVYKYVPATLDGIAQGKDYIITSWERGMWMLIKTKEGRMLDYRYGKSAKKREKCLVEWGIDSGVKVEKIDPVEYLKKK